MYLQLKNLRLDTVTLLRRKNFVILGSDLISLSLLLSFDRSNAEELCIIVSSSSDLYNQESDNI